MPDGGVVGVSPARRGNGRLPGAAGVRGRLSPGCEGADFRFWLEFSFGLKGLGLSEFS